MYRQVVQSGPGRRAAFCVAVQQKLVGLGIVRWRRRWMDQLSVTTKDEQSRGLESVGRFVQQQARLGTLTAE
jgi:hypothetical protein